MQCPVIIQIIASYLPFASACSSIGVALRGSLKRVFHSIAVHPTTGSFLLMCFCRGNRSYVSAAAEKSCVPRDAAHQLNVFRHSSDLAGIDLAQLHVLRAPC